MRKFRMLWYTAVGLVAFGFSQAIAQQMFIYPKQGQSQEQLGRDRYECHSWAVQQSGYDPARPSQVAAAPPPPPPPRQEAPGRSLFRGAARGAALGAVGGAIAGNAGKGAAIGAATGSLFGLMRRRGEHLRQQQAYQRRQQNYAAQQRQQQSAQGQLAQNYNRAMAACLDARGYTVR